MDILRYVAPIVIAAALGLAAGPAPAQLCSGDCNADQQVTIEELTGMVSGLLSGAQRFCPDATPCPGSCGHLVVRAVGYALRGCPPLLSAGQACGGNGHCQSGRCRERCCADGCVGTDCCDVTGACAPAGTCTVGRPIAAPCEDDGQCASGVCDAFDQLCCARRCNESTEFCNLSGACVPFTLSSPDGRRCDNDLDCDSLRCDPFDRVCCDRRCDPLTEECSTGTSGPLGPARRPGSSPP